VISDLSEAKNIQHGDILITHYTDIGWSPYFPLLAGIVTELGGLISHGAVVAREYGLPCIVGAKGATQVFQSGKVFILRYKNDLHLEIFFFINLFIFTNKTFFYFFRFR